MIRKADGRYGTHLHALAVVLAGLVPIVTAAGQSGAAATPGGMLANNCSVAHPSVDPSPADDFTRLVEVDPSDTADLDNRTPLVLIHGIHGNRPEGSDVDDVCQPHLQYWQNLLDYLNASTTAKANYKVYSFHYVSDRFSVWEIARGLRNDLDQKIVEDRRFDKSIVLVVHSMGGLVARHYMNHHSHNAGRWLGQRGGERVQKLVTLGTPHHGSPSACSYSRDQIASSGAWAGFLDVASFFYWKTRDVFGIPVTHLDYYQHNRKDLLWDNFDNRFDARNDDINQALAALNRDEKYGTRIVAYYGYLTQDDAARQALIRGMGTSESTPGMLPGAVYEYHKADDKRMLLMVANIAMDLGLKRHYQDNDGLVPRTSGALDGLPVRKRVACPGYDHLDMLDGLSLRCDDRLPLFQSLALELGVNPPPPGRITTAGVVNSASFSRGPVAPGEIVTIFGSSLGSPALRTMQVGADGRAVTLLGGTRVLFDGVAAPLLYASQSQVSAIVPYSVAGKSAAQVVVDYQGVASNTVSVAVAAAAPGIFTADSSGRGQAAALNQDGTLNSAGRPIEAGQVVVLFATGEGQTTPAGQDGLLARTAYPRPRLPVSVRIGGLPAEVLYAGAAPGLVAGVIQVNARVPAGVAPGQVPVIVTVGEFASQTGVTVAVRNTGAAAPDASPINATWDVSEHFPRTGFRAVRRIHFKQSGTSLAGESQDIYVNNTSRRGGGTLSGTNRSGVVNYRFRAATPTAQTDDATVELTGTVSPSGDLLSGTLVTYFDSGGTVTGIWNATRRRLRASSFEFNARIQYEGEQVHLALWAPRGARMSAEVLAERIGSPLDPVLEVLARDAEDHLASDDDTFGVDPKVALPAEQGPGDSQLYYLRVRGFEDSTGLYRLAVSIQAPGGQSLPWVAQPGPLPLQAQGTIGLRNEADVYAVDLGEGATLVAEVTADRAGSALDPVLTVLGPDGITELAVSDDEPGLGQDSRATFTTRFPGRHFLVVQSYDGGDFGPAYTYTLTLRTTSSTSVHATESMRSQPASVGQASQRWR